MKKLLTTVLLCVSVSSLADDSQLVSPDALLSTCDGLVAAHMSAQLQYDELLDIKKEMYDTKHVTEYMFDYIDALLNSKKMEMDGHQIGYDILECDLVFELYTSQEDLLYE